MAEVIARTTRNYQVEIEAGAHRLLADEPRTAGGDDTGPDPYSLLLAALGACISITTKLYATRKGWPLERVNVRLRHQKIHAEDCADCETKLGFVDEIIRSVSFDGNLTDEQRARLREIATKCPVHRTLTSEIVIREED